MEEEQKEKVSSDERGEGEKKTNVPSEGEWVEEMGVDVKEDQVLAALGNIGRWQVQIIMITGYISAPTGVLNVTMCHYYIIKLPTVFSLN